MKKIFLFLIAPLFLLNCALFNKEDQANGNFSEISTLLSQQDFEIIKSFVLEKGNRKTYRNYDNNSPHYKFENFDVFLGSDIGQKNIDNDAEKSDFNELAIRDWNARFERYTIIIVRKGDLLNQKQWIQKGMKEEKIYLIGKYKKEELIVKKNNLSTLLKIIKRTIETDK